MHEFIVKTAERAGKTFLHFYFFAWFINAGIVSIGTSAGNGASFDYLFTLNNVKAGVVGVAFSLATSLGSKPLGPDTNNPSVV